MTPTITNPTPHKNYEIILGKGVKVTMDKRSKTRVVHFPFEFPDGSPGALILCKVKNEDWVPHEEVLSVQINFK